MSNLGIDERLNVVGIAPTRRTILNSVAVFLGVLRLEVNHSPDNDRAGSANTAGRGGWKLGSGFLEISAPRPDTAPIAFVTISAPSASRQPSATRLKNQKMNT